MLIKSSILYNGNRIIFNLKLSTYQNIITFITDNNILFLSEMKLNIPSNLHGKGNSNNLLEFLANNNGDENLLYNFVKYFMNLIDLRDDNDLKIEYIVNDNIKWQNMNIYFKKYITTSTTTTTLAPTTTTTTLAPTTTTTTLAPTTTTSTTTVTLTGLTGITYGRLYNWYAATDSRNIAPVGWHVPTVDEFTTLGAGGIMRYSECVYLMEAGTSHWSVATDVNNNYGFTALPGGYKYGATFYDITIKGYYWTTVGSGSNASILSLNYGSYDIGNWPKIVGASIRLIKDNSTNEGDVIIDGNIYNAVTIGGQVWLKQNLAVTHYRNGDPILSDFSGTEGAVVAYNNNENNVYY